MGFGGFYIIRAQNTLKKVALVKGNFGPHATDVVDINGKVTILSFPPNCTSPFQPVDMGVIVNLNLKYKSRLLRKILRSMEERYALREASAHYKPGTKGIDEGHDPICFMFQSFCLSRGKILPSKQLSSARGRQIFYLGDYRQTL